jgi:hypothetical protein
MGDERFVGQPSVCTGGNASAFCHAPSRGVNGAESGTNAFSVVSPEWMRRVQHLSTYGRPHESDSASSCSIALVASCPPTRQRDASCRRVSAPERALRSLIAFLRRRPNAWASASSRQKRHPRSPSPFRRPNASADSRDRKRRSQGGCSTRPWLPTRGDHPLPLRSTAPDRSAGCMVDGCLRLDTRRGTGALSASSGLTVAGMARELRLSPNAIKTHLRRVFAKTKTGRQAELTRLVASLAAVRDALDPSANH